MNTTIRNLLTPVMIFLSCNLYAQKLIRDCNNKTTSSNPYFLATMPNGILFFAQDDTCGRELWFSDGTPHNTYRLVDANPGIKDCGFNLPFVDTNRTFAFIGTDHNSIWTTDGTVKSTVKLMDIASNPPYTSNNMAIKYRNKYYLMARDSSGNDIIESDGTVAGTKGFIDLGPGDFTPFSFLIHKDLLYFLSPTSNSQYNYSLYKTDGTNGGTQYIRPFGSLFGPMISDGNYIYFTGRVNGSDAGLFRYDPKPDKLDTVFFDTQDRIQSELFLYDNKVYFNTYNNGIMKAWYNDGTPGLNKLITLSDTSVHSYRLMSVKEFPDVTLGILLTDKYAYEYWKMENKGTHAKFILDVAPGTFSGVVSETYYVNKNGKIYFEAFNSQLGMGIWSYDVKSETIASYFNVPNPFAINQIFTFNGRTYMMAFLDNKHGNELYSLDDPNVSLNPLQNPKALVYPNPIHPGNALSIDNINPSSIFRLYDLNGKMLELRYEDGKVLIPEELSPGLYNLVIQDSVSVYNIKLQIL